MEINNREKPVFILAITSLPHFKRVLQPGEFQIRPGGDYLKFHNNWVINRRYLERGIKMFGENKRLVALWKFV